MMPYRYIKAVPKPPIARSLVVSLVLMSMGALVIAWTMWPIVAFTLLADIRFAKTVSPVAESIGGVSGSVLAPLALAATSGEDAPVDYTNANVWFPTKPQKKIVAPVNSYRLSIPKLKISNAIVTIAGDDLNKSLVHYGGTGLPGEYGTAVVFGHSTLPQFYNPTNYRTIFSTLPTLTPGDEILVEYDGIQYRYVIYDMVVTKPNDLSPLEQRFDDSYLTLITCVPPGTYWDRLNVKAKLVKPQV